MIGHFSNENFNPSEEAKGVAAALIRAWQRFDPNLSTGSALGKAIQQLVLASNQGSSCSLVNAPETLLTSPLVQVMSDYSTCYPLQAPLILVEKKYLYFARWWQAENQVTTELNRLMSRVNQSPIWTALGNLPQKERTEGGEKKFPKEAVSSSSKAHKAALAILDCPLVLIDGGPGTGKTTLVMKILQLLQHLMQQLPPKKNLRVALVAPTGKAATRLLAAMRAQKKGLGVAQLEENDGQPKNSWRNLSISVSTIHRLLGSKVSSKEGEKPFSYHQDHRLPLDLLVVDETSMVSLELAKNLLAALPDGCRSLMLGDTRQLPAIDVGSFFADLCQALPEIDSLVPNAHATPPNQRGTLARLTQNYRFGDQSAIHLLANAVHRGDFIQFTNILQDPIHSEVKHCAIEDVRNLIEQGYRAYFEKVQQFVETGKNLSPADFLPELFAKFQQFQVLHPLRQGKESTASWNLLATQFAWRIMPAYAGEEWYPGRALLMERNDGQLGLSNGDIGIMWPDQPGGKLVVYFPDANGGWRKVIPEQLPFYGDAYVITVHKAQGSEYAAVLLLLPNEVLTVSQNILTRSLLYTAITRAKERVTVAWDKQVLGSAILAPEQPRLSGLVKRLNARV